MPFPRLSHYRRINAHNLHTLRTSPLSEISGSLGDLGTLLPLVIALTLTSSISLPATLVFSGLANIVTGLAFGIPLPVQPMKAIASVAISRQFMKPETAAAGVFVGAAVSVFSATGALGWFGRVVPVPVVRGIQVGAGLSLVIAAGGSVGALGWVGPTWADNYVWAMVGFVGLLLSSLVPRFPYALVVTVLGVVFAAVLLATTEHPDTGGEGKHWFWRPEIVVPDAHQFWRGAIEAGVPQLPLTTLNSILAVASLAQSLTPPFPAAPGLTEIGLSVGVINLVAVWFGAMPVCHGSGGLAGQYRFGAKSGASVIILGTVKLLLGLFAGEKIVPLLQMFPKSLLGIMVLAAGVELAKVGRSLDDQSDLWEDAEVENEEDAAPRMKKKTVSEKEAGERWIVMLVTVAGCLAFHNDAVGFIAGMVWHWGLQIPKMSEKWRRRQGPNAGIGGWRRRRRGEESEGLLSTNHDAHERRLD